MDHNRLQELSALVFKEAKTLLSTGDPSAFRLTDPIVDSGKPECSDLRRQSSRRLGLQTLDSPASTAQTPRRAWWIAARARWHDLRERIVEFERHLPTGASLGSGTGMCRDTQRPIE